MTATAAALALLVASAAVGLSCAPAAQELDENRHVAPAGAPTPPPAWTATRGAATHPDAAYLRGFAAVEGPVEAASERAFGLLRAQVLDLIGEGFSAAARSLALAPHEPPEGEPPPGAQQAEQRTEDAVQVVRTLLFRAVEHDLRGFDLRAFNVARPYSGRREGAPGAEPLLRPQLANHYTDGFTSYALVVIERAAPARASRDQAGSARAFTEPGDDGGDDASSPGWALVRKLYQEAAAHARGTAPGAPTGSYVAAVREAVEVTLGLWEHASRARVRVAPAGETGPGGVGDADAGPVTLRLRHFGWHALPLTIHVRESAAWVGGARVGRFTPRVFEAVAPVLMLGQLGEGRARIVRDVEAVDAPPGALRAIEPGDPVVFGQTGDDAAAAWWDPSEADSGRPNARVASVALSAAAWDAGVVGLALQAQPSLRREGELVAWVRTLPAGYLLWESVLPVERTVVRYVLPTEARLRWAHEVRVIYDSGVEGDRGDGAVPAGSLIAAAAVSRMLGATLVSAGLEELAGREVVAAAVPQDGMYTVRVVGLLRVSSGASSHVLSGRLELVIDDGGPSLGQLELLGRTGRRADGGDEPADALELLLLALSQRSLQRELRTRVRQLIR